AQLACPSLVECDDRGKQKRDPHQATGDSTGFFGRGIEGKAENHDDEQREKQHRIDRVFRSPLQANVLGESGARDGEKAHRSAPCKGAPGEEEPGSEVVRLTIRPASMKTNSSA